MLPSAVVIVLAVGVCDCPVGFSGVGIEVKVNGVGVESVDAGVKLCLSLYSISFDNEWQCASASVCNLATNSGEIVRFILCFGIKISSFLIVYKFFIW